MPGAKTSSCAGWLACALAALLSLPAASSAEAREATARDLQVIARAVAFMTPAASGNVEIGIVFPAAGRSAAEQVAAAFGEGVRANTVLLKPVLVPVEQVGQQASMRAMLLTEAALPQAGAVAGAVAGRGVLTIAADPAAIAGGHVVLTVRSEPSIEILVNRAAASAAGVNFAAAFRMVIQER